MKKEVCSCRGCICAWVQGQFFIQCTPLNGVVWLRLVLLNVMERVQEQLNIFPLISLFGNLSETDIKK